MTGINVKRLVTKRIPIVRWLPHYNASDALGDLVAGLTVGLTLIPQAIAYASLAGLSAQYGLYSSFAGSLIYIAFGTCREVNIGPTALISLLTFTYARGIPEYSALLCFLSGCVTIVLGVLRLGFLVEFVSTPVVSGFTSAASVIIACSQIKGLLGIKIHGERFVDIWKELYENISKSRMPDLILSCCCIIVLLVLKNLKEIKTSKPGVKKTLWFLGIGRNAIVVIITAGISYYFETLPDGAPYLLTGHIEKGLPSVEPPVFSLGHGNGTVTFTEMLANLGTGVIVVPLISLIGNVAIAKAFARGQTLDATQEMLTLGLCNIAGSFFHSMPVTGSFSRSAVNNASGVRTPMGGLYTGLLVILALTLLTPYFYYIPRATLSSVIICAVIFMIELSILQPIWKCSRRDLLPALVTFFACLFAGVELGILIGVAVDLAIVIYFNARPKIDIEYRNTTAACYVLVRPSAGLQFPAVSYLKTHMTESLTADKQPTKNPKSRFVSHKIVLDCKHIDKIDFTALQGLSKVIDDLKNGNGYLVLLNPIEEVSQNLRAFVKDPILTAHSDFELVTILKQLDSEATAAADASAAASQYNALSEVIEVPIARTKHVENASTHL